MKWIFKLSVVRKIPPTRAGSGPGHKFSINSYQEVTKMVTISSDTRLLIFLSKILSISYSVILEVGF